ncbi:hypothetical protein [Streptomyces sp. NPDC001348]
MYRPAEVLAQLAQQEGQFGPDPLGNPSVAPREGFLDGGGALLGKVYNLKLPVTVFSHG